MGDVAVTFLLAAESRSTWPSYLAFALLALGLIGVVWHNQRARRRARRTSLEEPEESGPEAPE